MNQATRKNFELRLLRRRIEDIAGEFRYFTPAADDFLIVLQELTPDIAWVRHSGGFGGFGSNPEICIRAARSLRIREEDADDRTADRIWHGILENWDVTIYYNGAQ